VTDEEGWLRCNDPEEMLDGWLKNKSRRKQRLFACACCRLIWEYIAPDWREAVEASEKFADGEASKDDVRAAIERVKTWDLLVVQVAASACNVTYLSQVAVGAAYRIKSMGISAQSRAANLLRDVFCFRHVPRMKPHWQTSTATALAQAIYTDRAFDRLPILADALEDAGCDNADILNHCRQGGEHVRGCWVVDLILGKK
jgi:hypothetical protein